MAQVVLQGGQPHHAVLDELQQRQRQRQFQHWQQQEGMHCMLQGNLNS